MNTKRINRLIAVMVVSTIILAGIAIFVPINNLHRTKQEALTLQAQASQISYYMNKYAGYDFCTHISLFIHTDSDGNSYLIGKLDPELDTMLVSLVDAYHIDPRNSKHITVDEVRYNLTEGIIEATTKGTEFSAFYYFLCWCDTPADLIWKEDIYSDGKLLYSAGDPTGNTITSNFEFVFYREKDTLLLYSKYPWE